MALCPFTTVAEVKLLDIPKIHAGIHKLCQYVVCFSLQLFPTHVECHMVLAFFSNGMYWVGLAPTTELLQVIFITHRGTGTWNFPPGTGTIDIHCCMAAACCARLE